MLRFKEIHAKELQITELKSLILQNSIKPYGYKENKRAEGEIRTRLVAPTGCFLQIDQLFNAFLQYRATAGVGEHIYSYRDQNSLPHFRLKFTKQELKRYTEFRVAEDTSVPLFR
jgi:hypothetical protein